MTILRLQLWAAFVFWQRRWRSTNAVLPRLPPIRRQRLHSLLDTSLMQQNLGLEVDTLSGVAGGSGTARYFHLQRTCWLLQHRRHTWNTYFRFAAFSLLGAATVWVDLWDAFLSETECTDLLTFVNCDCRGQCCVYHVLIEKQVHHCAMCQANLC